MDACQMAAMAEATRLTRQGRLIEATALIQRTLASPAVTRRAPDAPCAGEETGGRPGRHPDPAPPLAFRGGTLPRLIPPGWTRRGFPRPGRDRSPPRTPARGTSRQAAGGPV